MQSKFRLGLLGIVSLGLLAAGASWGDPAHYVSGVEGIKAGSLPPPGVYGRLYTLYYHADTIRDDNGDKAPLDPDLKVMAAVPRLIWITPVSLLGADYGMDILVPIVRNEIKLDAVNLRDQLVGVGDLFVEPLLLSWHLPQADASGGFGVYFPTGNYEPERPASPGLGFYTYMFTLGGTYYVDADKSWAASALGRYEINSYTRIDDLKPGDALTIEWGLSKNIAKLWEVGAVGYCHWQITDDHGSDAVDGSDKERVFAAGPEVSYFVAPIKMNASLRYEWEFLSRDRPEGQMGVLTLTKIF